MHYVPAALRIGLLSPATLIVPDPRGAPLTQSFRKHSTRWTGIVAARTHSAGSSASVTVGRTILGEGGLGAEGTF